MHIKRLVALSVTLVAFPAAARAQKKVLTQADWDIWKSISSPQLTSDGKWAVYSLVPQVGDGELVVRSTSGPAEFHVPRGYIGRPNNVPGGLRRPGAAADPYATPAQITADNKFVLVTTQPTRAEVERSSRTRTRLTAPSLAIVRLPEGTVTTVPDVRSFRLPRDNGRWLAYSPAATPDSAGANAALGAVGAQRGTPAARPRRQYGSLVVLRDLSTGDETRFADVVAFAFDDSAKVFAYTVVSRDSTKDGAYVRDLATGATTTLLAGRGDYKNLAFDDADARLLFVSDREEFGRAAVPRYALYEASLKGGGAQLVVSPSQVPDGLHIADGSPVSFTRNGAALMFEIAAPPIDSVPADSLVGKAVFDLWHYKDPVLQPTQRINAARDRSKTYTAIYFPSSKQLVRLEDDSITAVTVSADGKTGVANSRTPYMISSMWGDGGSDVYVIDVPTNTRKLVRAKIDGQAQLSPGGKYVGFYDHGHWYSYNVGTGKLVDLSGGLTSVHFENETDDHPAAPPAWGIAGWTAGDRTMLVYDHFDIWALDPAGVRPAFVLTDSAGRRDSIQFRLAKPASGGIGRAARGGTGDEDGALDPREPLLLKALNTATMASGFYTTRLDARTAPTKIVMADVAYGTPVKAAHANEWMVTKSTFVDFPNLWVGSSLTDLTKISDANPQQKDYNWGTAELVRWRSADGIPLKGILYKPENFDPHKKYPMIAYFYEVLSNNLHSYVPPTGRNIINPTHYVSNGYLVFEPDIVYEDGYPGPSAVKSVVPGVQALVARGYVDEQHLGLQGQSWGGYQTAFIITQTHMFAAAMAGAPVANMTSAYGGIRWGTGISRAGQYETGQSRIGKPLVDAPQLYIANSPLFWLRNVTTPLFIMSNDMDDAVPWYQGIEFFIGMRRLGKEVYLIDYNNDVHNPASRANQKDIARRMQEFFDNKLKGAPAPDWMVHGIPYTAKGRDQLTPVPAASAGTTPTRRP